MNALKITAPFQRKSRIPNDRAEWLAMRAKVVTSTEVAALFGYSPYTTEFEMYHRHAVGHESTFEMNDRMKWGIRLEQAIAEGIAEDEGWNVAKMDEFITMPDHRLGASFDFRILAGDTEGEADGILEIKNVDSLVFRDGWIVGEDGEIEAPLHIEIQLQTQLLVSGLKFGYIGVLVGGNDRKLLRREASAVVQAAILTKVNAFWKRVDSGSAPQPDFARDATFISELYGEDDGSKIEADDEVTALAETYRQLSDQIKTVTSERETVKARILIKLGAAAKCQGADFTISAPAIAESLVPAHARKGFRSFRITFKKVSTK